MHNSFSWTLNINILLDNGRKNVHKVNWCWATNIWFKMVFRSCFYCLISVTGSNSCCCMYGYSILSYFCCMYGYSILSYFCSLKRDFPFWKNVFGSTFWFKPIWQYSWSAVLEIVQTFKCSYIIIMSNLQPELTIKLSKVNLWVCCVFLFSGSTLTNSFFNLWILPKHKMHAET